MTTHLNAPLRFNVSAFGGRLAIFLTALFIAALSSTKATAQVPISYYDFENNTTRTTFENAVEQQVNSGNTSLARESGGPAVGSVSGAGNSSLYSGPAAGQAASNASWSSAVTDPGNAATTYYQFTANTSGFTGITIKFDAQRSATGPANVGLLYSADGGTSFVATTTQATSNGSFITHTFDLTATTAVDNKFPLVLRIYGYASTAGAGTFRVDNLQVMAVSTSASAGSKNLLNEPNIFTSTTSGGTGIFSRSGFTATGNTSVIITSQLALTGSGFTITNDAAFRIDAGGFVSGQGPTYNVPSFLSYNTGGTYGRGLEWSSTSGAGYPNKVAVNGSTTLDMGANGGTATARQISGFLTVNSGTFQMAGANPMTQPVTVLGGVNVTTGSIILSTSPGGDLKLGGDWTRSSGSTFTPNNRAVFFNGSGAQSITITGAGGIETFSYLVVDKPGGSLVLNNSPATNVIIKGSSGDVLQLLNAGNLDLNGRGLTLQNDGGNVLVSGGVRTVTGGGGSFAFTGSKTVTQALGGSLVFDGATNVTAFAPVNFGAGLSTVNGTLTIGGGGSVNTNAPTYGNTSTLIYDCVCVFGRSTEWSATSGPGYPNNVTVNSGTNVNIGSTTPGVARQIAGSLDAKSGGGFLMDHPAFPMTAALNVLKDVLVESGGSLKLSSASGGDLRLQGNFTNNGTFVSNNRAVFFEGGATQTALDASGTLTMPYVRVNKSGGTVELNSNLTTLGSSGGDSMQFTGATSTLTLNGRTLTLGSTVGTPPAGSGLIGDVNANLSLQNGGSTGPLGTLVFVSGGQLLGDLTINRTGGAGSATLGSNLTVNNALNLTAGDILTGAFTLTHNGTSTGTTDVIGNVRRTDLGLTARQFGNPNNQISFQIGTAPVEMTVNLLKSKPTGVGFGFPNAVERTYTITPTGGSGFTATLRLHYNDSELNGNTEALLDLWRFNGTSWNRVPKTLADPLTNNWIESSAVTQFSPWTLSATPLAPTAARLLSFKATAYVGGTVLEWQTSFEVDNLGFNLYREEGGRRVLITPSLVAGSALTAGQRTVLGAGNAYAWADRAGTASSRYWLEAVSTDGKRALSGPFWSASSSRKSKGLPPILRSLPLDQLGRTTSAAQHQWPVTLAGPQKSSGERPPVFSDGSSARQLDLAAQPAVKLHVRRGGWYRVTRAQLEAAGLNTSADPARLQLYADGVEQSARVDEAAWREGAGAVEFYGEGLDTPSTDTRVYWLIEGDGDGRRLGATNAAVSLGGEATTTFNPPSTSGGGGQINNGTVIGNGSSLPTVDLPPFGGATATGFPYTLELRERTIYFSSLLNGEKENFFGRVVSATPGTQQLDVRHIDIHDPSADANPPRLEVALQGVTQGAHRVSVFLNDAPLGALEFAGRANKAESFAVPVWMLRDGANEVRLVSGAASDVSLTESLRLTYPRQYRAEGDTLRFTAEGDKAVRAIGFTTPNVRVVDITDPLNVSEVAATVEPMRDIEGEGYAVTVAPGVRDLTRTLYAYADAGAAGVEAAVANQPSGWRASREADFVIITHSSFREATGPLAARRTAEGLKTEVVDVEDLYDEFSQGAHTPQAVKDFLAWTTRNWARAPRYVLLVGDGSYDPRDYTARGSFDLVPTKLLDTTYMETASDNWYADFDGDGLSEMAVGRLPVRTAAEAAVVLSKITSHEPGGEQAAALMVADRRGADGYDFEAATTQVQNLLPAAFSVKRVNRGAQGAEAVRAQIVSGINTGPSVVNWMGHGSVGVWTGEGLLRGEDAARLTNGSRLPLFVMMTCLNGYYHDPSLESLSESLLKAGQGGALAVWTSTGMTEPEGQAAMNRELFGALFGGTGPLRLGEAMQRARTATADADVRRTWVLIGDPTTRVR